MGGAGKLGVTMLVLCSLENRPVKNVRVNKAIKQRDERHLCFPATKKSNSKTNSVWRIVYIAPIKSTPRLSCAHTDIICNRVNREREILVAPVQVYIR